MTRKVITVSPETSIVDAADTMLRNHVSGLPVVDAAGRLAGIVSEGDFIRRAEIGTQHKQGRWLELLMTKGQSAAEYVRERGRKVSEIMTSNPVTIAEDTPIEELVRTIERRNVKHLPVMRGDRLVGIVTRSDLVRTVATLGRNIPDPTAGDDHIRSSIIAAMRDARWSPCRFNVIVRNGIVDIDGVVTDERCRQAAIVAAENVPGVRQVHDQLCIYPPPEEEFGGGDFVSLQQEPPTVDDAPL
jgi:CBS domain-containing protein